MKTVTRYIVSEFLRAGFRVYFGFEKQNLILLLLGGHKGSQKRDIKKAQQYWVEGGEKI